MFSVLAFMLYVYFALVSLECFGFHVVCISFPFVCLKFWISRFMCVYIAIVYLECMLYVYAYLALMCLECCVSSAVCTLLLYIWSVLPSML